MAKKIIQEQFDVLVVGGGPAGLMAAGRAAEKGARVALVEKNDRYGIKLLMTGNGRSNVTQENENIAELTKSYRNGRFLMSSFNAFSPTDLRRFLLEKGVETKLEKNGRIFPISDQSKDVLEALYQYCRSNGVTFFHSEEVLEIEKNDSKISKVVTKKKEISAKNYVIATGGKSYPQTGSSGQGYLWAKKIGHTVVDPQPLLVPIKTHQQWSEAQGISAHSVSLSVYFNNKKVASEIGDIMFAHYGFSGPLALNISRTIGEYISKGDVKLILDLKPQLSLEKIDEIIRHDFEKNASKNIINCLKDFASPKLLELIFKLSGVDTSKHAGNISKEDRLKISKLFKNMEFAVEELFGFEKAMVTRGGISIKEIDSKTMKSKILDNLYFAGEIIDVDGPTGGYNLQISWSTGFVAGENAAKN